MLPRAFSGAPKMQLSSLDRFYLPLSNSDNIFSSILLLLLTKTLVCKLSFFHPFSFVVILDKNFHVQTFILSSILLLFLTKTFVCKLSFFHPFLLLVVDYQSFVVQTSILSSLFLLLTSKIWVCKFTFSILSSFLSLMIKISMQTFHFFHPFCCCSCC